MNRKERIDKHLKDMATEVYMHIKEKEGHFPERWVPASEVKTQLELNYVAVPQAN